MLKLTKFDQTYFELIEGKDAWIAIGNQDYQINYNNQKYFTVVNSENERIGIVGIFDFAEQKNLTHIVISPKYRNQGLLKEIYELLIQMANVDYLIATISVGNLVSVKAHEKAGFEKISDAEYEKEYQKLKYQYKKNSLSA